MKGHFLGVVTSSCKLPAEKVTLVLELFFYHVQLPSCRRHIHWDCNPGKFFCLWACFCNILAETNKFDLDAILLAVLSYRATEISLYGTQT
jgi:hypothetical protein